eukprot:jgi/Antlo1/359/1053
MQEWNEPMDEWPRPPHYENPQIPEVPAEVFCFGERIVERETSTGESPEDIVADIRALVRESELGFRKALETMETNVLERTHRKIHKRISELERAVQEHNLWRRAVPE